MARSTDLTKVRIDVISRTHPNDLIPSGPGFSGRCVSAVNTLSLELTYRTSGDSIYVDSFLVRMSQRHLLLETNVGDESELRLTRSKDGPYLFRSIEKTHGRGSILRFSGTTHDNETAEKASESNACAIPFNFTISLPASG